VPIVFLDRRVGKSKMSRRIFVEAFRWVLATRLHGDPAVRAVPATAFASASTTQEALERPEPASQSRS
jgi:hypothetical protein